jgi:hypothetical protein
MRHRRNAKIPVGIQNGTTGMIKQEVKGGIKMENENNELPVPYLVKIRKDMSEQEIREILEKMAQAVKSSPMPKEPSAWVKYREGQRARDLSRPNVVPNGSDNIPTNATWTKVAISPQIDRFMLDIAHYTLPYYEVLVYEWGDSHTVTYVEPGDTIFLKDKKREVIDLSSRYHPGPFHNIGKAMLTDSKKRGLPTKFNREDLDSYN